MKKKIRKTKKMTKMKQKLEKKRKIKTVFTQVFLNNLKIEKLEIKNKEKGIDQLI